jgi:hypothetical protein
METTTAPLTFGDTFTLPLTGDHDWKLQDTRPVFAHLPQRTDLPRPKHTAYAKCSHDAYAAWYTPGEGWSVSIFNTMKRDVLIEQLEALDVDLPHKSPEAWAVEYRRMLGSETRNEVGSIIELVETWTHGTDIDPLDLKAHVAATAALTADGAPDNVFLFTAVYNATLATLKGQQA